jgi:hypothetical protein
MSCSASSPSKQDPCPKKRGSSNAGTRASRTYNQDGSLETDSTAIREYDGTSFNTHVYGLSYDYDLNGRRTSLFHPNQLAPAVSGTPQTEQMYDYNAFGALGTVTNVLGNEYGFFYDLASRADSVSMPYGGGYVRREFDDDGRMTLRQEVLPGALGTVRTDSLWYDQRNKVTQVEFTGNTVLRVEGMYTYAGLGQSAIEEVTAHNDISEDMRIFDALGNAVWHRRDAGESEPPERGYIYNSLAPQLKYIIGLPNSSPSFIPDTTYNEYDVNGNMRYTGTRSYALSGSPPDEVLLFSRRAAASYYGADQKLMFHQVLQDSLWNPSRRSSSIRMNAPGRLRSTGTMRWAGGY